MTDEASRVGAERAPEICVGDYVRPSNAKHPRRRVIFEVSNVRYEPPLAPQPAVFGSPGHSGHSGYWIVSASTTSPCGDEHPLHMTPEGWTLVRKALGDAA